MSRDTFYEQILAGLNGLSNSERYLFQDCMTDLLRGDFPSLVPVRGGKDSGMDGAIADGKGEPYPLIVTTANDVERNLRRSLASWLKRKRPRRKIVLATSQALTPERQHKLKDLARKKRFTLVGLIEQSGVADRLLWNGYWCERLLGLTGEPSTLSVVPLSRRHPLDIEPVGRDADIEWLKTTSGDRVLSGAPGSGKTFLLYHLTRQGWGVFVANPDGPIAKDLLNQRPEIVIFDDAHVRPDFLDRLRNLRRETKVAFSIIAITWEGGKDQVIEALGVGETQVHKLELLTRAEIVEVYRRLGVDEDPDTMRFLVDQAANKPGLAATIATLWLQGSWKEVIEGKALSRTLLTFFDRFVGRDSTDVLAALSLGGDRGMEPEVVREYLGFTRPQLRQITAGLAAGGVLSEVGEGFLAVWPRQLRTALIQSVFFPESGARYNYRDLIGSVPHLGKAVEALLALGAAVPSQELRDLVLRSQSENAWRALGQLSKEDARWVLENYPPDDLMNVAPSLLRLIPRAVIPRIIERAAEPTKKTGGWSLPEQPMNILSTWVENIGAGQEEWIWRRQMVARAAKKYLGEGGKQEAGVRAICTALSPKYLGNSIDPGRGDVLTEWRGLLPLETLRQVEPIWDEVKEVIQVVDADSCHHLVTLMRDWYHQYSARNEADAAEKREFMREFACRVLRDLTARGQGSPGVHAHFGRLAEEFEISLELEQDPIFLLLYNHDRYDRNPDSRREREAVRGEQIKTLATEWAQDDPKVVVQKIAFYEEESKKSSGHMRHMWDFCWELAKVVQEPESWLDECLSRGLKKDLAGPFLWRIVHDRREGWENLLKRSLDIKSLQWMAATLVLELPDPPPALLAEVFDEFSDLTTLVEQRCQNRRVPIATLRKLLQHSRWDTALAAAAGEWWAEPQGEVREEILADWRSAMLRARTEEYRDAERNMGLQYSLGVILSKDASLALEWLRNRLGDPDLPLSFMDDSPFAHALRSLGKEQRLAFLQELEPVPIAGYMIPLLIQEDVECYGHLLSLKQLSGYHLEPLAGLPQKGWSNLALVALHAEYEPARIAEAAFKIHHTMNTIRGTSIEYWEKWDLVFAEIGREGPPELKEVSRYGREIAQRELQGAKGLEAYIDTHGLVGGLIPNRSSR